MAKISPRTASYLLVAVFFAAACRFHLGSPLVTAFFSYTLMDVIHRRMPRRIPAAYARWLALGAFSVIAGVMVVMLIRFLQQSLSTVPVILATAVPRIVALAARYHVDLPFENLDEFRRLALDALKENAARLTQMSSLLTEEFIHILAAIFVAILVFMGDSREDDGPNLHDVIRREVNDQFRRLIRSFERVLGAQIVISAINTTLTAVFLLALDFPYIAFLVPATFILGVLPVVGNILGNVIITGTALTLSPLHAALSLAFLIVIHKGEYFLNSRIVGSSIQAPMWQTLLGILIGKILLGVSGIMLAPAVWHYLRGEMLRTPCDGITPSDRPRFS